jgi:hypothetical protein
MVNKLKKSEDSLNISHYFTAINKLWRTEESKTNGNVPVYYKSLFLYAYFITSVVDFA